MCVSVKWEKKRTGSIQKWSTHLVGVWADGGNRLTRSDSRRRSAPSALFSQSLSPPFPSFFHSPLIRPAAWATTRMRQFFLSRRLQSNQVRKVGFTQFENDYIFTISIPSSISNQEDFGKCLRNLTTSTWTQEVRKNPIGNVWKGSGQTMRANSCVTVEIYLPKSSLTSWNHHRESSIIYEAGGFSQRRGFLGFPPTCVHILARVQATYPPLFTSFSDPRNPPSCKTIGIGPWKANRRATKSANLVSSHLWPAVIE